MTKHLRDADFVVMVCTERYYARVMGLEEPGVGRGVRWEGNLIFQHLSDADTINRRFVPILFEEGDLQHIPDPLRPFNYYQLEGDPGYLRLYRHLTNQPTVTAPPLGKLKSLPQKDRRQGFFGEPPDNIPLQGPIEFVCLSGTFGQLDPQYQRLAGTMAITSVARMGRVGKTNLPPGMHKAV